MVSTLKAHHGENDAEYTVPLIAVGQPTVGRAVYQRAGGDGPRRRRARGDRRRVVLAADLAAAAVPKISNAPWELPPSGSDTFTFNVGVVVFTHGSGDPVVQAVAGIVAGLVAVFG